MCLGPPLPAHAFIFIALGLLTASDVLRLEKAASFFDPLLQQLRSLDMVGRFGSGFSHIGLVFVDRMGELISGVVEVWGPRESCERALELHDT